MHTSVSRHIVSAALLLSIAPRIVAAASDRQPDFNGDGYADLVMGASGEKIGQAKDAGAINIVYGTADGLKSDGNQIFNQGKDGLGDVAEAKDYFGIHLAFGDFNGDGYSDLVASATGEDNYAGSITVLYGSASGLAAANSAVFKQGVGGMLGTRNGGELFGYSLAIGDFNGDGHDDLAAGASDENAGGATEAGAVHVIYGSASGLTTANNQMWWQSGAGLQGLAEDYDYFGTSLAAGDFNGDGKDDLAAGAPYENGNSKYNCGSVNVIYGSASGLSSADNQFWHQDSPGVANSINGYEYFGWALAAGDFNNDGKEDLAVGVDSEDVGGKKEAGAVHVLYGSGNQGLRASGSQYWTQESAGVADEAEAADRFGAALGCGDFNGDGFADLVIGALDEGVGSKAHAGAVHVLFGSANKLSGAASQLWSQDSNGVQGVAAANEMFGSMILPADFNGDGRDDLALGAPYEKLGSVIEAGSVTVLYSGNKGPKATGNQVWTQDSPGILDKCENYDTVGYNVY